MGHGARGAGPELPRQARLGLIGLVGPGWIRPTACKRTHGTWDSNMREGEIDANVVLTQRAVTDGVDRSRVIGGIRNVRYCEQCVYGSDASGERLRHGSCISVHQQLITSTLKTRICRVRSMSRQRATGVLGGESTCGDSGGSAAAVTDRGYKIAGRFRSSARTRLQGEGNADLHRSAFSIFTHS